MRRYSWLLAVLMVFAILRPAMAAPMFPDVPDMWAKDAVAALAAKGILEGYPDGTFKGDRAATRYEVAMIVARLLAKEEQEHATFATKADLDELRRLVNQLKEELDALGVRVQNLEDNVAKLDKRVTELERITFYGSLDTRWVSMRVWNTGLSTGINGSNLGTPPVGANGGGVSPIIITPTLGGWTTNANPAISGGTTVNITPTFVGAGVYNGSSTYVTGVGVPVIFSQALNSSGTVLANAGRPIAIYQLPYNMSAPTVTAGGVPGNPNQSYNQIVGSAASLGNGNPFTGMTGVAGVNGFGTALPLVLPTFEMSTGRPWTQGQGLSGQGILGVKIRLNEDMDAGAEFAAYYSTGDPIVDAFWGVSARRLSNVFAGNPGVADAGQGAANAPWTRMNIDNFWFLHKPSNIKVQVGAYGDTMMDSIVYQPEYNPNYYGPKYLDNFGMRISGSHHVFAKIDWEVFGSNVAQAGSPINVSYKPYLWGADIKFTFGEEGNTGRIKFNVLRIWDDNSSGVATAVGNIAGMNGVWLDWANPSGYYAAQLNPAGPSDPGNALKVAGQGSTTDVRPIVPGFVASGNQPGKFGTDMASSGLWGAAWSPLTVGTAAGTLSGAGSFGPQSMFTWGLSGGWDYTMNDDVKWRFFGEYGNSSYKPSANSAYNSPQGNAYRIGLGVTMFKDFDLDGEYVDTNPYYNPYIMQYPSVNGVLQANWRLPNMSWFPEAYPVSDKDIFPDNRNGWRVFFKWNPVDSKDGKRKTVFWGEYGNMSQDTTSLQNIRYSPGSIAIGNAAIASTWVPNGYVLGMNPGFVDTVFTGYSPLSYAGYTGVAGVVTAPTGANEFATPLENPRGKVTNWGVGVNYRFDALNGLGLHVAYKNYQFQRNTSLIAALGGEMNQTTLNMDGGIVAVQYPFNERFSLKAGYAWSNMNGHYDPTGIYQNYALDTGSVNFQTVNESQTSPFIGFDYDVARNVNWNMTAKWLTTKDNLNTFSTPNFFLQRNPFSWNGLQLQSQVKVSF